MTNKATKELAESRRRETTRVGQERILTKNTGLRENIENDEVNDHFQHTLTFTSCPDGWNRSPGFPQSQRLSLASKSSFLGTNYHSKFQIPGPGMHDVNTSTIELRSVSATRSSDWARRWRNCRPLIGSDATASLYGADKLLQEPGPDPGTYKSPDSTFRCAIEKRNFCSSTFASQSSRFPPTKAADHTHARQTGAHDQRAFARTLPRPPHRAEVADVARGAAVARARRARVRPATVDGGAAELEAVAQAGLDAAVADAMMTDPRAPPPVIGSTPPPGSDGLVFAAPIRVPERYLWMPGCEHEIHERHKAARDVQSLEHFKPPRTDLRV